PRAPSKSLRGDQDRPGRPPRAAFRAFLGLSPREVPRRPCADSRKCQPSDRILHTDPIDGLRHIAAADREPLRDGRVAPRETHEVESLTLAERAPFRARKPAVESR